MNVQPTLELGHLELHLAENTDSSGCLCCWKSKTKTPKEFIFDEEGHLVPVYKRVDEIKRKVSNAQLNQLLLNHLDNLPIETEKAFRSLKNRIGEDVEDCSIPITKDRIRMILDELHALRLEIREPVKKKYVSSKSSE